jgi:hypothetical protein
MKPDKKLTELAGAVALEAPLKPTLYTTDARIPWDMIFKIRTRLDELGVDWEAMWHEIRKKA